MTSVQELRSVIIGLPGFTAAEEQMLLAASPPPSKAARSIGRRSRPSRTTPSSSPSKCRGCNPARRFPMW